MKRQLRFVVGALLLLLTGCSAESSSAQPGEYNPEEAVTLNVFAAASLESSFEQIAERFTVEHPMITVELSFAGSATLVQHLEAGAPADVFVSADEINMDKAQTAALIDAQTREVIAANTLVGIVPADNPGKISSLEDTTADDVKFVMCAPQVPCGALSQQVAKAAGVTLTPVSEEQQVSDVLGKVRSGQADAGLVYATDAALYPTEVQRFDIETAERIFNTYPIARTTDAQSPKAAQTFVDYVRSEAGQAILQDHGFLTE